jgi:hypothetical protein
MLNIHPHRVTDLADAEAWADARHPSRYLHTQPVIYQQQAPFPGGDKQGRYDDRPWRQNVIEAIVETKIADGAHAASEHGMEDAAPKRDLWVYVFGWGAAALTVGWVCFWVFLWRAV